MFKKGQKLRFKAEHPDVEELMRSVHLSTKHIKDFRDGVITFNHEDEHGRLFLCLNGGFANWYLPAELLEAYSDTHHPLTKIFK